MARTDEIPSDRVFWAPFQEVGAKVERDLDAIIKEVAADPDGLRAHSGRKIADLYDSMMDEARIERLGLAPARAQLQRIDAISTPPEMAAEAGRLSATGVGGPFDGTVGEDPQKPGGISVQVTQGGTLLPDRDHYLDPAPRYVEIRAAYEAYLTTLFTLVERPNAEADARALLAFETELAKAQWTVAETRRQSQVDLRFQLEQLGAEMPGFDWIAWAKPQGLDRAATVILAQPTFKRFAASPRRHGHAESGCWRYRPVAPFSASFAVRGSSFARADRQQVPTER
jgi:predicted metalloendopeptidase